MENDRFPGDEESIEEDGILWQGTADELDAWKRYKQQKAIRFVERGYSVSWYPNPDNWMEVFTPERELVKLPELRAYIKAGMHPSPNGINGGRIFKLNIRMTTTDLLAQVMGGKHERIEEFYNYDRGLDIDRLDQNEDARALYDAILKEMN